ncbi:MAG: FtsQ-type POTRA domain-containing protein [bacterium]|nr:FtsQ-type POTRA domain-containing protein [bacterium]MDT8365042.1 FtsQ-type POTRA domain-containing protein [bacterium]
MKRNTSTSRKRAGKPAKRVSMVKKKRTGFSFRHYLVRGWWIFRGGAVGVLALGIFYGGYLGFGKVMGLQSLSVRTVEVEGCQDVQPDAIRRLAGVVKGDPLLRIDLKEVRRKVITHPWVKEATVVRELPDTLRISVKERAPVAVVLGRQFALVDNEGVVLSLHTSYPKGYPVITGIPESGVPGRQMIEAQPAIEILRNIPQSGLIGQERISELGVEGELVKVSLMGSGTVLVFKQGSVDVQMKKLARLMEAGIFDTRSAGYDLRFADRVVGMPERKHDASGGNGLSPAGG